jgi:phosphoribosylamine--glycine ligase
MRVCVVGSGGREHALASVLARDAEVVVTPGSTGMTGVEVTDQPADHLAADLFVIGPEDPLVKGLADRLRGQGKLVFGPGANGARLEGSKAWMKQVLADAGVPTAAYASFGPDERLAAETYLRDHPGPYVVKTDGLAAGKGVLVTSDLDEAIDDVRAKLAGTSFGEAGRRVVIEQGLDGPEISLLAVCDGTRAVPLALAQDHKRVGDGDTGPNTGGMGAYSPVPFVDDGLAGEIIKTAVEPTLAALRHRAIDYRGVLYAGLMLTADGPRVLEYNVRFGDPEAQVVLPRLSSSLTDLLAGAASGRLSSEPRFGADAAVCVVAASEGYPLSVSRTGVAIHGLKEAASMPGVEVFHAATRVDKLGRTVTSGGRVLGITALGRDVAAARDLAYRAIAHIGFEGMQYRADIAASACQGVSR